MAKRTIVPDHVAEAVRSALDAAIEFAQTTRQPDRLDAIAHYNGTQSLLDIEGRSQFRTTEVKDTIMAMLPVLMGMFFGGEEGVEYAPQTAEDAADAEQANLYVNQITLQEHNAGFLLFYTWLIDAFTTRLGIVKVSSLTCYTPLRRLLPVPPIPDVSEDEQTILDNAAGIAAMGDDPSLIEFKVSRDGERIDIRATRETRKIALDLVMPANFFYESGAATVADAKILGDITYPTRSDLLAMGLPRAAVEAAQTEDDRSTVEQERYQRDPSGMYESSPMTQKSAERVRYVDAYMALSLDEDDLDARWYQVRTLGSEYAIATIEECYEHPYSVFCPNPQPHRIEGLSVADDTKDIQDVNTKVTRAMLDSLAETVVPRTEVVEGQVNMRDVMDRRVGGIVRVRAPGMMREVTKEFAGAAAFPMLDYFNQIKENRTGTTRAAIGLDPTSLQSSTRAAVEGTMNKAAERVKLIAHLFSETALKPLYRRILYELTTAGYGPSMVKFGTNDLREVDPSTWSPELSVRPKTALGHGTKESRIATLTNIVMAQEKVLETLGPVNPIVTLAQYRDTMAEVAKLSGFMDDTKFFQKVDPNYQPPEAPPEPNVELEFLKLEGQKAQLEDQRKQNELQVKVADLQSKLHAKEQELALKTQTMLMQDDRERDKVAADNAVKLAELELKYNTLMTQTATQLAMHGDDGDDADTSEETSNA